ncbi:MAG: hypothetical protein C0404_12305, partial [Verrucomicrobia bacterium]|nr:hypothetical protein [Verrucomicrobiota bacterium]
MAKNEFRSALTRMKRIWRSGLALCALLRAAGYVLVMLLCVGLLDYFLAFESLVRATLDVAVATIAGFLLLKWLAGISALDDEDAACRADDLVKSRRRSILSALELDNWLARERGEMHPLQAYLMDQSVEVAASDLGRLGFADHFPFRDLWQRIRVFAVQATVAVAVAALNADAAVTIVSRFSSPFLDIPP